MAHRTKRNHPLNELVTDFETKSIKGEVNYMDEKSFHALINYYEHESSIDKAIEVVEYALNQFSYCVDFYVIAARLYICKGALPDAKKFVDHASILSPNDLEVILLDVKVLALNSEQDAALFKLSTCKKIITGMEKVDLYLAEASIFESMKDFGLMFDSLAKALWLDPKNETVLEKVWRCTEISKKHEESIQLHEAILDIDAYNYLAWFNLGQAYSATYNYVQAINAIEYSFVINEEFEAGYMEAGELCCQVQDYVRALHIFLQAAKVFGLEEELYLSIIKCFIELKRFKKAKKYLIKAIKQEFYNDELYYYLGLCFMNENKLTNAIAAFQKAIKLHDRREEYYCELAKAYVKNGEFAKAHVNFRKATETGPDAEVYWIEHIQFLLKLGKKELALEVIEQAEFHSVGPSLAYCKAALYIYAGQEEEGLEILEEALLENPKLSHIFFDTNPILVQNTKINSMVKYYEFQEII